MLKKACTKEQIKERKDEIVLAVNIMFDTMDYQDISMKTISENISIARSSLYCYYKTKEEIMLDILKDEYISFIEELTEVFNINDDLANKVTDVFLNHKRLLKIISNHLIDIETHCSLEKLIEFKSHFVSRFSNFLLSIKNSFPNSNEQMTLSLYNSIIMLTHSLYPMIEPNPNQKVAMETVGMTICNDERKYCSSYINFILGNMK